LKPIGIIANPASGKDIRRLVAYGSVFDNVEKTNIVKRILKALDALNVRDVFFMPDSYGIGRRAIQDVEVDVILSHIEMEMTSTAADSQIAAGLMADLDVACIITLGGDGTNRMVAKACGDIPLLPISTGTNNVFPYMIEGTLAGMAAGILADQALFREEGLQQKPVLEIYRDDQLLDIALIDIVVTDDAYVGSRAVLEIDSIREIFLSRNTPACIGFSSLASLLNGYPRKGETGMHIEIGQGGKKVLAPIAPGMIERLSIASYEPLRPKKKIDINTRAGRMLALDGEREIDVYDQDKLSVCLNPKGPKVVDVEKVLSIAAKTNYLTL
jgi:predicted polyphosphate/ATP-dependent NAD kinase